MKKITLIIFFIFINFTFPLHSNENIKKFKIEGFEIGENLSEYFPKKEIAKFRKDNVYQSREAYIEDSKKIITDLVLYNEKDLPLEIYEVLTIGVDEKNKIYGLAGLTKIKIKECMNIKSEIQKDILNTFWRSKVKVDQWHDSQEGDVYTVAMDFENGEAIVQCYKIGWLKVQAVVNK